MKFAHLADCHLGVWRQPEMQVLNLEAFEKAIDSCIAESVDFVLIAGDLFDIAIPSVDVLKTVASKLRELKEKNIGCYVIPGSHDFSASGKSMIAVLEKAGLCKDATNRQLKAKSKSNQTIALAGVAGKKGGLEQQEIANKNFGKIEADFSILMLHTAVSELANTAVAIPSLSMKDVPEGFDYYALGHLHQEAIFDDGKKIAAYPGALFPTSFSELEQRHNAVFFIIETKNEKITKEQIRQISQEIKPIVNFTINADGENPLTLKEKILKKLEKNKEKLKDAVLTLRIEGILARGKPSELDFRAIEEEARKLGTYCILKNLSKLESREFELKIDEKIETAGNIEELEQLALEVAMKESLIEAAEKDLVTLLIKSFDIEKAEDETNATFSERLTKEMIKVLNLEL